MKITLPCGRVVDSKSTSDMCSLSDEDWDYVENQLAALEVDDDAHHEHCRCQRCIDEDNALIDAWERRQAFREGR